MIKFLYTNFPKQYGTFLGILDKVTLPIKILLFKLNFKVFFGSKNQDKWVIEEVFKYKKNGYFLDIAATDGIHQNNTFFLEKRLKWNGICIEPNKQFFNKLLKTRTAIKLCEVIDSEEKKINFFPNGGVGGIIGDEYDNNQQKRSNILNEAIKKNQVEERTTQSLLSILESHNAPKIIDYFSLDVEGAETKILRNFPFDKYIFLSLTIERPTPELNDILFKNDYIFVKNYKVDSFYIHKSLPNKSSLKFEKFSQIEPKKW